MNGSVLFQAKNVNKKIGKISILQDINLDIYKGENTAIIGNNGSGKSSLIKLIAGIYEPTSGVVKRTSTKIAYVPEHFPFHIRFKMMEYLMIVGEISGQPKKDLYDRIMQYAKMFFIEDFLDIPLKNCSKGTKQKAGLLQALLSKPDLLLLDEPLSGLDPESQFELLHQLMQLKGQTTIVFTAHENMLVDEIADALLELHTGRLTKSSIRTRSINKMLIKARLLNKEVFQKNDRFIEIHWENDSVVTVTVEATATDQVLLDMLTNRASILEVKELK